MARRPWYRLKPHRLNQVRDEVLSSHPRLKFDEVDGKILLTGVFELREGGWERDKYCIEIELSQDSEHGMPVVRETGGRIPRDINRHVNAEDGTLCVMLPEAFWYDYPKGLSLLQFLDGPLTEHLAGQSLVELGEPWPAGEWGHGSDGILEFYREALGTDDPKALMGLSALLATSEVKGHWLCPCGSGKRLRVCHGPKIIVLRTRIPRELAGRARAAIQNSIETLKKRIAISDAQRKQ
ncbi:MAG: SEC-C domain-containing protein [Gemmatimonadales bacterium]|nr:SEC-C domain-containing protein [Gemmatimonadales bacterium]